MNHEVIVITGTRCSGKSTLVTKLIESDNNFGLVKAVTTRAKRSKEDEMNYYHVTREDFEKKELLVSTKYHDNSYGIEYIEIEKIRQNNQIPILIITPESFNELVNKDNDDWFYLSFFIDAENDILDERLGDRNALLQRQEKNKTIQAKKEKEQYKNELEQRQKDREFAYACTYRVNNSTPQFDSSLLDVIKKLWNYRKSGGILPKKLISLLIKFDILLKDASEKNISNSSYDLSLGDEYYYKGEIKNLTDSSPFVMIEPYDYAIVTSKEYANFPNDIAGRFDLKVSLFCQGIILSNGPQVDPGFEGKLFCLLFNTSNSPVTLKRSEHYATLEFNKLLAPTQGYAGVYQSKTSIIHYLPSNTLQGGVNELKKEVEKLKAESTKIQGIVFAVISLLLTIVAIYRVMN